MKPGVRRSVVLLLLAFAFMAVSMHPFAIVCYMLLTALFRLSGDPKKAGFVVLLAAAQAGIVMNSLVLALAYAAGAGMGFVLALTFERRWSYGWQLTLATGTGFAAVGAMMLWMWGALRHDTTILSNSLIAMMQEHQNLNPAETASQQHAITQLTEAFRWMDINYPFVAVGSTFGSILFLAAVVLCLLERWRRNPETRARRKPTGFQQMRLPDWMVWFAIAAALMCMADTQWPNTVLRMVGWNAAFGLFWLYLLNGVSLLFYALTMFKVTAFGMFMLFSGMFLFGIWPTVVMMGLFDTWYDFRMRARRLAMLRRVLTWRMGGMPPD